MSKNSEFHAKFILCFIDVALVINYIKLFLNVSSKLITEPIDRASKKSKER